LNFSSSSPIKPANDGSTVDVSLSAVAADASFDSLAPKASNDSAYDVSFHNLETSNSNDISMSRANLEISLAQMDSGDSDFQAQQSKAPTNEAELLDSDSGLSEASQESNMEIEPTFPSTDFFNFYIAERRYLLSGP
jgi:hypothetical protein